MSIHHTATTDITLKKQKVILMMHSFDWLKETMKTWILESSWMSEHAAEQWDTWHPVYFLYTAQYEIHIIGFLCYCITGQGHWSLSQHAGPLLILLQVEIMYCHWETSDTKPEALSRPVIEQQIYTMVPHLLKWSAVTHNPSSFEETWRDESILSHISPAWSNDKWRLRSNNLNK